MWAWVTSVVAIVKILPDLISVVNSILKIIHEAADAKDRAARAAEMKAAILDARVNRDTSKLDQMLGGKSAPTSIDQSKP